MAILVRRREPLAQTFAEKEASSWVRVMSTGESFVLQSRPMSPSSRVSSTRATSTRATSTRATSTRATKRVSGRRFVPWFVAILATATVLFAAFARSTETVRHEARTRFLEAEATAPRGQ